MMEFSKKQEESIQSKIELYSPLLERDISQEELMKRVKAIEDELVKTRLEWFEEHKDELDYLKRESTPSDDLFKGLYMVFFQQMGIAEGDDVKFLPVYYEDDGIAAIFISSRNFCPYLEAFRRMGIRPEDSVRLCELTLEKPCQVLFEKVNPKIRFFRNYSHIRPIADYCDERLLIRDYSLSEKLGCL